MKFRPAALFSLIVLIFFCVFVYEAREWRMQARLYPYAIGIPMLICAIIQFILDLKGVKAKESADGTPMDFQFQQTEVSAADVRKRTLTMFGWMLGFFLMIWLLGYVIAIPVMVFSYLKFQSNESWMLSTTLTVIAFVFFYTLFVKLLTLPFPEGLLITRLGLGA
ncbi:MAG TPA: tripartite tricarboxylate transporter TctB family protein [Candidatus Binatia bacterium]|nr:tripartite tricarboxylate transporter TctB family protein [Candidatus Binatia bacterium]